MLSGKLIQMIEPHEVDISGRIVRAIRHDPGLAALAKLPDAELRECASEILRNLGHWLTRGNDEKLAREYENIAKGSLRGIRSAARVDPWRLPDKG
jgi:hypothetical protein